MYWTSESHSSTTMSYSTDGTRLFSCGSNKEGESFLVEWNESEGAVKRTYHGLGKRSVGVVQFDTTKNRFLAAGDEFMVKFWDMDNTSLLTSIDADGGLPASPCIRFNKDGILLAISTSDNGFKILANAEGIRLLRTVENRSCRHHQLLHFLHSILKIIILLLLAWMILPYKFTMFEWMRSKPNQTVIRRDLRSCFFSCSKCSCIIRS